LKLEYITFKSISFEILEQFQLYVEMKQTKPLSVNPMKLEMLSLHEKGVL